MLADRLSALTPRREQMLRFIRRCLEEWGRPPTVRDMVHELGFATTSAVDYHLKKLQRAGLIRRQRRLARGIELVGARTAGRISIVGRIAAGQPIEAIEERDQEALDWPPELGPQGAFALRVKGKSMVEDYIDDGDLVLVRPQHTAEDGDIVVALITGGPTGEPEATLKRLYREGDRIRLQPANAAMPPIYIQPQELQIQGKVIAVIRRL